MMKPGESFYAYGRAQVREEFAALLSGNKQALVLVVSYDDISESARAALDASAEAFGYGPDACCFAAIGAEQSSPDDASPSTTGLGPKELFRLVEGLDPLCIVATDADATQALGSAYRIALQPDETVRVFGHTICAFANLNAMMESPESKQRAWALLKRLPRA